ncbi:MULTISPECIES: hypothetical protein [unclassified Pseudomonas]|uniref:hypothetical protein n=1 Tax=unclassified Pseudomonas TaxID=196821 RepID=UPI00257CB41D|nr:MULTISPECIES: hypothetical protein [unclassified Pseudomonas]
MASRSAATDAAQQPRSDPERDRVDLAQVFNHQNRILGRVVQSLRQGSPQSTEHESAYVPVAEPVDETPGETQGQAQSGPVPGGFLAMAASKGRAAPVEQGDYPPGADATPSTEPGHGARQRGAQAVGAARSAAREGRLDALIKVGTTAAKASTAQEWGEGLGGAVGGLAGSALGAALSKYTGKHVDYGKVVGGFYGDKAGAALGKRLAPDPETSAPSESTAPQEGTETSSPLLGQGLLVGGSIGAAARIHDVGKQTSGSGWNRLKGWFGKDSPAANEPYPLGADAGPSPTDIGKRPPPWKTVGEVIKAEGKNALLESALKAVHTYASAKTAQEAWEGYGGAVGGLVGSIAGGVAGRYIPPIAPVSVTVGGALGDEAGTRLGGWIARKLAADERPPAATAPLPAVSLLDPGKQSATRIPTQPFFDLQIGAQTGRQLLSSPELARQQQWVRRALPQVSLLDPLKHSLTAKPKAEFVDGQVGTRITRQLLTHAGSAQHKPARQQPLAPVSLLRPTSREALDEPAEGDRPLPMRVPPAATALPEPGSPATSQASEPQPSNQHFTFNTNMPVTLNGSLDDPALLQRLEAMVQRTLQELISRKAAAQLSDPIYA